MAHHVEPMDIDSDFDNKENSLHHNNVLPFTEKGYEELDVSDLNMKLRYSVTPVSSPMSKSYTANCVDNRSLESGDDSLNVTVNENSNLTRSLNSTITRNDSVVKSLKALPLQAIPSEQFVDSNRNTSVLRSLDTTITPGSDNVTVMVSTPSDIDENLSLPSSSSSTLHTPEATTPTKDIPPKDGGSPIMRGLKSVLSMFRTSQSPIPPVDNDNALKPEILSPVEPQALMQDDIPQTVLASTPIAAHRKKEMSPTKRTSPQKDLSIVFNEDLEKELQWKDETTILFSQERIPIHKLMLQTPLDSKTFNKDVTEISVPDNQDLNSSVEYMDISYNGSMKDRTLTDVQIDNKHSDSTFAGESDSEFVDCETTFTKNDSHVIEDKDKTPVANNTQEFDLTKVIEDIDLTKVIEDNNDSGSRLKPIILDTTQDILDATLSVRPEDLLPDILDEIRSKFEISRESNEESHIEHQILNQTINVNEGLALETMVEDPNATKTLDVSSTTLTIDQTFNVTSCDLTNTEVQKDDLNVTKTKDNILSETQIVQTNDIENLNTTLTNETITLDNKTFGAESTPAVDNNQVEELNKTEPINNCPNNDPIAPVLIPPSLEEIANKLLSCKDTEVKIVKEDPIAPDFIPPSLEEIANKLLSCKDTEVDIVKEDPIAPVFIPPSLEEIANKLLSCKDTEVEIVKEDPIAPVFIPPSLEEIANKLLSCKDTEVDIVKEDPIAPVFIPPSLEEIANKLILRKDTEVDIVKESSITELPVDVPLPDEDDLDKELNLPTEITTEAITPSVALPLDLVDEVKTKTEITDVMNIVPNEERQMLTEDMLEKAEIDNVNADSIPESDINNQKFELNPNTIVKELNEAVEATIVIKEKPEPAVILLENTCSNTVIVKENESTVNTKTENMESIDTEINVNNNSDANNMPEKIKEQKDIEVPIDINESVCEFKPLPDVINQTISYTEKVESTAEVHKAIKEVVEKREDRINSEVQPGAIYINEPPATVQPLVETNKVVEELITNKSFTIETDTNMIVNQLNEVTKASITEKDIPITKDNDPATENVTVVEKVNMDEEMKENITDIANIKVVEEEIIVSENNSPFVSVIADNMPEIKPEENTDIETVTDTVDTTTKVVFTPPSSPPIRSKGYNFNFEDLDFDPFATKTNIRISPPLDSPNKPMDMNVQAEPKVVEKRMSKKDNNRRKSQPERKRPAAPKRKFNSTFDGKINVKVVEIPNRKPENSQVEVIELQPPSTVALSPSNVSIEEKTQSEAIEFQPETLVEDKENLNPEAEIVMGGTKDQSKDILAGASESSINIKLKEVTSSSELSTYYSAGTSSSDTSIQSRNVFNLPEIDDMNFNPFATKSKMRQSPPPDLDIDNPFITKSKVKCSPDSSMVIPHENKVETTSLEDKIENEPMEKEVLGNLSNTTTSSKATDEKHTTTSDSDQIRTEDEDTVEGPFLEAEDLNTDDKMSYFDGENIDDMMQFNELPTQSNEDNVDNGEMFIDAEAFEFLLNQNKSNIVVDSGKESLFLKFDPLFAKRMSAVTSDGVVASLARLQRKQSTPTKAAPSPPKNMPSPIAGPSNLNVTQDIDMNNSEDLNDDLNITVSKPMMVVPPAVNPVTPRNKSLTPNRTNRHSITFTSPAMAVIDRLLSLSSNNSMVHDTTVTHVSREQNEADIALSQLRELLAEKEISVYQLRSESRELRDRLSTLESNVKSLENVCEDRLKKINQLNDTLAEKTKINRSMAAVVEEYERTIASLIAETAQDKKRHAEERIKLINERDEQTAHLTSMEVSFSDLHSKYEKSKQVILNCKANEEAYKKSIKDFEENFTKMQNNYELLKQHATSKLNHANQEMEKINRTHEAEVLKLNAMIKRKELHITSLEESLNQKTKANEELTAICDELINKVG